MKWFKHDSDARNSLKLRKVRRKFGADGYAIYWFCLEAIAYDVDKDNLTFDLKEDAETIAFELSIQEKRVEEIMLYLVNVGLFENTNNTITCLKLAERLDKSMTNSPKMRAWLESNSNQKTSGDVMTLSDSVKTCVELDKIRLDKDKKKKKDLLPKAKKKFCPAEYVKELENNLININAWVEWCNYRKSKKKPVSKQAADKQLKTLAAHSDIEQQMIVDQSIANDYTGLFSVKGGKPVKQSFLHDDLNREF